MLLAYRPDVRLLRGPARVVVVTSPRTPAHRDAGWARVGNLTLFIAAGGVASVGVLAGVAASSTSTSPTTTVPAVVPSDAPATSAPATSPPATDPATTPAGPSATASTRPTTTTTEPAVIQPPTRAPSSGRHGRAAANSGGS